MKKPNTIIRFFSLALLCSFFLACAEAPKKEEKEETTSEIMEEEVETESMSMEEDNSFMLPSPIQIAAIFNRAGLGYESNLTNPVSNLSKYNTKTSKYLNFGVYSADLAYVVLNRQQQESIDYLNTVKNLSESIGMPSIFGSGTLMSFEKNINNQDTVLAILTTIKSRTDEYLRANAEESKEAVFFAGAWVEGMYLGANSSSDMKKVTPKLIEQMTILKNIIKALKVQRDQSLDLNFLITGLEDLHTTFEGLKSGKQNNTDRNEFTLTPEELKTLTSKITDLRTRIIKG